MMSAAIVSAATSTMRSNSMSLAYALDAGLTPTEAMRRASAPSIGRGSRTDNPFTSRVRGITMQGRPVVDIQLNGAHGAHGDFMTSYSTMDTIEGTVNITATQDTRFDELDIEFVGISKTYVDRLTSTPTTGGGRTTATHRFLRLSQPINEEDLPHPRIFSAGQTYRFPFTFVVPQQLLPRSCNHKVENDAVQDAHLQLPPSMGDPEVSGFASKVLDDMAPEMAKVLYVIKVRGLHYRPEDDEAVVVVDRVKKLRIKPAFEEQAPLSIDTANKAYRMRKEKTVRKSLFKGRSGTLIMEAQQPKSLHIPGARSATAAVPISTVAKVLLRFDPADDSQQPPKLGSISSRLKVATYHASTPRSSFPTKEMLAFDISQGYYCTALPLSARCIANTPWTRHTTSPSPPPFRRDSASSTTEPSLTGIPHPSKTHPPSPSAKSFYTAQILVPLTLPTTKNFLPTFHSCLVSRIYILSLSLSLSGTPLASDLSLKVPVQVSQGASPEVVEEMRRAIVDAETGFDVDAMLRPRNTLRLDAPPGDEYGEGARRASVPIVRADEGGPPEYSLYQPRVSMGGVQVLA